MLKETFKKNKGITLIALVVTIIVLLILAGISIVMLTGQNGILNRAAEAKEKTEVAQEEENEKLKGYEDTINQYIPSSNGGTTGGSLPTGTGTTPYLPDESKFEKVEGTDLNTGLVIKEKKTGSEYVWVEVPRTTAVYPEEKLNITEFTDEEYNNIETYLHTYTNEYRKGTSFNDVYYKDDTKGWFTDEAEYNTAKKKMLKSVYQNGGFWVGRYEAGIEENRTVGGEATTIPLSKENLYPYNYVTRTQAKVLAEQVESGSYTSSLMFGVQWDLVLKYIETKNPSQKSNLLNNSTTIGNYYNSAFTLNGGKFAKFGALADWKAYNSDEKSNLVEKSQKKSQSSYENGILLTTGSTEATNLQNIYDIAGNVWEWTLEKTSDDSNPCAGRGGSFVDGGSDNPASSRGNRDTWSRGIDFGFRFSLY